MRPGAACPALHASCIERPRNPAQRRDTARLYLSDDGDDVRSEAIRIGLVGRNAERVSCRLALHRYVPAPVMPSRRLILITVCARYRDTGLSVSLRRASHDGGACVPERAADPLHRARIDTEPLGDLTDAFGASRLVESLANAGFQPRVYWRSAVL